MEKIIIPIDCIMNKFKIFDINKLFVASITPNISFSCFLWCFCDSKNVINSGILVTNPRTIPIIISGTLNLKHRFSNVSPNKLPIINNTTSLG